MSDMLKKIVFDKVGIPKLGSFLDLSSVRQRLLAGNIANVLTPGYTSKDINFQAEVLRATETRNTLAAAITHPGHIPLGDHPNRPADIIEDKSAVKNGINNVSVDEQMATLSVNQINYTVGARMLEQKFATLRKAIRGSVR